MNALVSRWTPEHEKSSVVCFISAGAYIGTTVALPASSVILDAWGWHMIFYIWGAIGLIWCLAWSIFARSACPSADAGECPSDELNGRALLQANAQLEAGHGEQSELVSVANLSGPTGCRALCLLASSQSVWAIGIASFCFCFTAYLQLTELPTFLAEVLGIDVGKSGVLTALPNLALAASTIGGGLLCDALIRRKDLSLLIGRARSGGRTERKRRLRIAFNAAGLLISGVCLVGCAVSDRVLPVRWIEPAAVVLMTLAVGASGLTIAGWSANIQDVGGVALSGLTCAVVNTFATLPGVLAPVASGALTDRLGDRAGFTTIFLVAFGLDLVGTIAFARMCSVLPLVPVERETS
jgi:ACS family sodium-dependent inorganic phosphate cotransporter